MNVKKFKVVGIKWDCDGVSPKKYNLPTTTIIEEEDEDYVIDALSDKYGWLIESVKDIIELHNNE